MKSLANQHNILKVLSCLACFFCFFLSSCSENSSINSFDEEHERLKEPASSSSTSNLLDNSPLQRGCIAANAWVEENEDNLPTSFAAISTYPVQYRKAIFTKLTPDQKANVWRDRLRNLLDIIMLTEKQHTLLSKMIQNLSPAIYDKDKNVDRDFIRSDERLKSIFGEKLAGNIFASLRPVQEVKENQMRSILYDINSNIGIEREPIDCTCSTSSDYCGLDHDCEQPYRCSDSDSGCGTFWIYDCNGVCVGWDLDPR